MAMLEYSDNSSISNDDNDFDDEEIGTFVESHTEEEFANFRLYRVNKYKLASLETLCLRSITENLSFFIQGYEHILKFAHGVNINGPFEGLPPAFLDKIHDEYEKLCENEEIPCDSAVIFMTKHALNLKLYQLKFSQEQILSILKSKCHDKLRSLSLIGCDIHESVLTDLLKSFKNLTKLNLTGTIISDRILLHVNLESLSELDLTFTNITENVINILCEIKLKNLEVLKLKGTMNQNNSIKMLIKVLDSYPRLRLLKHKYLSRALILWKKAYPDRATKLNYLKVYLVHNMSQDDCHSLSQACPETTHLFIKNLTFYDFTLESDSNVNLPLNQCPRFFASGSVTQICLLCIKQLDLSQLLTDFPNVIDLHLQDCDLNCSFQFSGYTSELVKNIKTFYFQTCLFRKCVNVIKDIFHSENLETLTILSCKYPQRFILDKSRSMYFKSLTTDCFLTAWIEDIAIRNQHLNSVVLQCPETDCWAIDANWIFQLNTYFRKLFAGKIRPGQFSFDLCSLRDTFDEYVTLNYVYPDPNDL